MSFREGRNIRRSGRCIRVRGLGLSFWLLSAFAPKQHRRAFSHSNRRRIGAGRRRRIPQATSRALCQRRSFSLSDRGLQFFSRFFEGAALVQSATEIAMSLGVDSVAKLERGLKFVNRLFELTP